MKAIVNKPLLKGEDVLQSQKKAIEETETNKNTPDWTKVDNPPAISNFPNDAGYLTREDIAPGAVFSPDDPVTPLFDLTGEFGDSQTSAVNQKALTEKFNSVEDEIAKSSFVERKIYTISYPFVNGYINSSDVWTVPASISTGGIFIPIIGGETYKIVGHTTNNTHAAFLKTKAFANGDDVSSEYGTGSERMIIEANSTTYVTAPSDANYLYVYVRYNDVSRTPAVYIAENVKSIASTTKEGVSLLDSDVDKDVWRNANEANGQVTYEADFYKAQTPFESMIACLQYTPSFSRDIVFNQIIIGPFRQKLSTTDTQTFHYRVCAKAASDALNVAGGGTELATGTMTLATNAFRTKTITLDNEYTLVAGSRVCVYMYRLTNKSARPVIANTKDVKFNYNSLPCYYIHSDSDAITSAAALTRTYTASQVYYCPSPVLRLVKDGAIKRIADAEIESKTPGIVSDIVTEAVAAKIEEALPSLVEDVQDALLPVKIWLPKKIYAVVGDTLQLFYKGMVQVPDIKNYDIIVSCAVGSAYTRYYELTPKTTNIGNKTLTITVKDKDGTTVGTASTTLKIVAAPTSPAEMKKIVVIGASGIKNGEVATELTRRLTGSSSTPNGITGSNLSNVQVHYKGMAGWNYETYQTAPSKKYRLQIENVGSVDVNSTYSVSSVTYTVKEVNITGDAGEILIVGSNTEPPSSGTLTKVSGAGDDEITYTSMAIETDNPLWDAEHNAFSFIPWVTANGGGVDVLYVALNANGRSPWETFSADDNTGHIKSLKTFIAKFHSEYPNAQVRILNCQLPSQNGGMGKNYGAGLMSDSFGMAKMVWNENKAYADLIEKEAYSDWVGLVDATSQFDCDYNYPRTFRATSRRRQNSTTVSDVDTLYKEYRDDNGLHPAMAGYYQIADAIWRSFVAEFCQSNG